MTAPPLRLLLVNPVADWRPVFDLIQGALALDVDTEVAFALPALDLLCRELPQCRDSARAFASLSLLGLEGVRTPIRPPGAPTLSLPPIELQDMAWRDWIRQGSLQVFA